MLSVGVAVALLLGMTACGGDEERTSECSEGATRGCDECSDGSTGAQTCGAGGTWGLCVCGYRPDADGDGMLDVDATPSDAEADAPSGTCSQNTGGAGACTNIEDCAAIEAAATDLIETSQDCGVDCSGEAECLSTCVSDDIGVSSECGDCFADLVACGDTDCAGCSGDDCVDCLTDNGCGDAFAVCAGFDLFAEDGGPADPEPDAGDAQSDADLTDAQDALGDPEDVAADFDATDTEDVAADPDAIDTDAGGASNKWDEAVWDESLWGP